MLNKNEKEKLKNDSTNQKRAMDDALNLFRDKLKTCRIVHKKTGLFFNGFSDPKYNQGKNTLSITNFSSLLTSNRTDEEIILKAFSGHIIDRNGVKLVHNNIVYNGSDVKKILSSFYEELNYLPVDDFVVEKDFKKL